MSVNATVLEEPTNVQSDYGNNASSTMDYNNLNSTPWNQYNFSNFENEKVDCRNLSVHDKAYIPTVRITTLYATIFIGTLGAVLVLLLMWSNRRHKSRLSSFSRVNSLILNLTIADLLVMFFAVLPQLVWEYQDQREWLGGAFLCKTIKFLQSFTLMASTNMVVIIAIDRHQAITKPLKSPWAVSLMNLS